MEVKKHIKHYTSTFSLTHMLYKYKYDNLYVYMSISYVHL